MFNRLPVWLRQEIPRNMDFIKKRLNSFKPLKLSTVCLSAHCPNMPRCFQNNSVTFMILGGVCTRNCSFCAVDKGRPNLVDLFEGYKIAEAVRNLGLKYVVITSVTRDDLDLGGAVHFARVAYLVKRLNPKIRLELLIPDFKADKKALFILSKCPQEVIGHNLETVKRLYPNVRPQADYAQSLLVLKRIKKLGFAGLVKSGIMLGLGERQDEILRTIADLRRSDCDILTLGQYLSPSGKHFAVREFINPRVFEFYRGKALKMGFKAVYSGPLVRSSYNANELYERAKNG